MGICCCGGFTAYNLVESKTKQALGRVPASSGRGGSCELMIGCIARARTTELHMDTEEMEDVRWVPRAGGSCYVWHSQLCGLSMRPFYVAFLCESAYQLLVA